MIPTSTRRSTGQEKGIRIHISGISVNIGSLPKKIYLQSHLHLPGHLVDTRSEYQLHLLVHHLTPVGRSRDNRATTTSSA